MRTIPPSTEPTLTSLASLLYALSGQIMSTGVAFDYQQIWVVNPEAVAQPATPSVYHGWNKSQEPVFAYRKTDADQYGAVQFQDTAVLSWDAARGDYEENHRGSDGGFFNKAQLRIVIKGMDSVRALHGAAIADTVFNWERDSASQPWEFRASIAGSDTTGGRMFLSKSLGGFFGGSDTSFNRIGETYDAQGFVVCRRTFGLLDGNWILETVDSMQRGADGMPIKAFKLEAGADGALELSQTHTFEWDGHRLLKNTIRIFGNDSATLVQQYGWNAQGKLVSASSSLAGTAVYAVAYDAQARVSTYSNGSNRYRYDRDAAGRIQAIWTDRRNLAESSAQPWVLQQLDSFAYAANGRMTEHRQFVFALDDSTIDTSMYTRTTYDYDVQVPVLEKAARRLWAGLRQDGRKLTGFAEAGHRVELDILRPDGRRELSSEGIGQASVETSGLQGGPVLWSLRVDGSVRTGGRVVLPRH